MQKRQKIAHELILMRFHPFIYDVKTKGYNEIGINVFLGKVMGLFTEKVNFIPSILPMSPLAYSKEEEVYKDAKKNQANVQLSCGPYKLRLYGIFFLTEKRIFVLAWQTKEILKGSYSSRWPASRFSDIIILFPSSNSV